MGAAQQTRYRIEGMDCAACAARIDSAVRGVPGVEDVSVSVAAGAMTVHHTPGSDLQPIEARVGNLGYAIARAGAQRTAAAADHQHTHTHQHDRAHDHGLHGHDHAHGADEGPWWRSRKGLLTITAGLALVVAYAFGKLVPAWAPYAFIAAMLVGLVPIARRALVAARYGSPFTIEMLMTIAAVGAVVIGAGEEAAMVVLLFLIGEMLEGVAAGRARASIRSLGSLVPKTARLEEQGGLREVDAETLEPGATILVRPGDRVPADGVILSGESAIDEAPVTGESTPVSKGPEAVVFAGTVNGDGVLRVRVTAAAADNTIARVIRLVEEAQEAKAPTERFIDRFSRYYTPGVVAVAALIAVGPPLVAGADWSEWLYKGLAILLIGCPCALVISTPAAIAAALAGGARRGLLMKGGAVLETLARVTTVFFDKTGTLTAGKPQITDIVAILGEETDVLRQAAALEAGSSHPLGQAILAAASERGIAVQAATGNKAIGGKGIEGALDGRALFLGSAEAAGARVALSPELSGRIAALTEAGKTVSVLLVDGTPAGLIAMRDEPRPDAAGALAALKRAGIGTVMLTGDNPRTAKAIGDGLGIAVQAGLLPEDKQRIVTDYRRRGVVVAKVGDGINDAPALAAADVGIAMGGGTDVALETADAAALRGRVGDIGAMIGLARRAMGNIRQNIAIALGLKAVFLVTTIAGITGLWPAILADTGATVLVTLNALRLLRAPASL
jgi:Cd2+/Zn2+-exporting ATPase